MNSAWKVKRMQNKECKLQCLRRLELGDIRNARDDL